MKRLPLYEAKMIHHFNHRWATYKADGDTRDTTLAERADPRFTVTPRYWVEKGEVEERLKKRDREGNITWEWTRGWLLGWRDITNTTNERTVIASLLPRVGVGDTFLLMFPANDNALVAACLVACLSSFTLDYAARQKVGGTHLKYHVFKQLPVLPPEAYLGSSEIVSSEIASSNPPLPPYSLPPYSLPRSFATSLVAWIASRVLELVYTAWDMEPFARDCGYGEGSRVVGEEGSEGASASPLEPSTPTSNPLTPSTLEPSTLEPSTLEPSTLTPFVWDEDRRFLLRCELDALYFHLYGIERDDVDYILETFPKVKREDEAERGEYRTRRVILEIYDELKQAMETGVPYQTRLDPPPAHGWMPPEELLKAAFAPAAEKPAPAPAAPEDLTLAPPPSTPEPLRG